MILSGPCCARCDNVLIYYEKKIKMFYSFCVSVHHLPDDYFPNYKTQAWHSVLIEYDNKPSLRNKNIS